MPELEEVKWVDQPEIKLFACGCKTNTKFNPPALIIFCARPDCLRLFEANVAYTIQQFQWQHAHGGNPELVAALLRPMVTPLPQILPPPPAQSGTFFTAPVNLKGDPSMQVSQPVDQPQTAGGPGQPPGGPGGPPPQGPGGSGGPGQQPGQPPRPGPPPSHPPGQPPHPGAEPEEDEPKHHPADKPKEPPKRK